MKLLDKWEISKWAYYQCKGGTNIEEIRCLIVDPLWAFLYCYHIKDIEEMRKIIQESDHYIVRYCAEIRDSEEMSSKIKDPYYRDKYKEYCKKEY